MNYISRFFLIPIMVCILFFTIAFTPVELIGCTLRGLLALIVAFTGGIATIILMIVTIVKRGTGKNYKSRYFIDSFILSIPLFYIYYTEIM
jgi:hypothetical protein